MEIAIERRESGGGGRYSMRLDDGSEAYITLTRRGGGLVSIDYSFVPPFFRGRGLAVGLIRRAVEDARVEGTKLIPFCGYVAAEFRRHRDWQDVLG